jgi:hypothetical protein
MKLTARTKADLAYLIGSPDRPRNEAEEQRWAGLEAAGYIEELDDGRREVTISGQTAYAAQCLNARERFALLSLVDGSEQPEYMIRGVGEATFVSLDNRKYITRQDRSLRFDGRNYYATITDRGRELVAALEADA